MTVIVTAVFTPSEGHGTDLKDAIIRSIPAIHDEQGCILFALHEAEDHSLVLIENWETQDLLDTHLEGPAVAALVKNISPFLSAEPQVVPLRAVAAGQKEKGEI